MTGEPEWLRLNRAKWDELVGVHLNAPEVYNLDRLRAGTASLGTIASDVLAPTEGLNVLHLQCHFGVDTLTIAQRGATVVGLDFSEPAVVAARRIAVELGLSDRSRFVQANLDRKSTRLNSSH